MLISPATYASAVKLLLSKTRQIGVSAKPRMLQRLLQVLQVRAHKTMSTIGKYSRVKDAHKATSTKFHTLLAGKDELSLPGEIVLLETCIQSAKEQAFLAEENMNKAESAADEVGMKIYKDELLWQLDLKSKLVIKQAVKLHEFSQQQGESDNPYKHSQEVL